MNKFGDLASKVSSNVSFYLKKLTEAHPGMKHIVTKEIEAFLVRPNVTQKSQADVTAVHLVSITRLPLTRFSPGAGLLRNPFLHR